MRIISLAAALLMPLSAAVSAAPVTWSSVTGEWQVVAVTPKKENGQIYIKNDPQFMGARVAFKPMRLAGRAVLPNAASIRRPTIARENRA
ncbi:hypothetical protein [Pantoea sp. SGAir0175]